MGARFRWFGAYPGSERRGTRLVCYRHERIDGRRFGLSARRHFEPIRWQVGNLSLTNLDHTLVMGILNVTPDSFSDGGLYATTTEAISHGFAMHSAGADIVDVGGESTRPGARPVGSEEEIDRVVPVVAALAGSGIIVSVDTSKAEVATAAIDAGAKIVNDVTAFGDPAMAEVAASSGVGVVLMHMQGEPRTMQDAPSYVDVTEEVAAFLESAARSAQSLGVDRKTLCLDPGIGFGKALSHNVDLLSVGIARLAESGFPVLVGASRKSFIAGVLGPLAVAERDPVSAVAHSLAIASGASIIRSHNVVMAVRTARVTDAIVRGL